MVVVIGACETTHKKNCVFSFYSWVKVEVKVTTEKEKHKHEGLVCICIIIINNMCFYIGKNASEGRDRDDNQDYNTNN